MRILRNLFDINYTRIYDGEKVKLAHYRPGQTLRVPGS